MTGVGIVGIAGTFLLALCLLPSGLSAADLEKGRKISQLHCARCHVIGDFNPNGGISSTPSFQLLVKAFKDWRERFSTFYARRPHPAFLSIKGVGRLRADLPPNAHPVELPKQALDDILAYVETLRPAKIPK